MKFQRLPYLLKMAVKGLIRRFFHGMGYNFYRLSADEQHALCQAKNTDSLQSAKKLFGNRLTELTDLRNRYATTLLPIAIHSAWRQKGEHGSNVDLGWGGVNLAAFRGHSAYVWSYSGAGPVTDRLKHYIFADAARKKDHNNLLRMLTEDGAFGCHTFEYPGIGVVSRDLLDSVIELSFLDKHLGLLNRGDIDVLDIGAGYGRMAHRMLEANPRTRSYTCVDAVPESTFLSSFYLNYRGLGNQVQVVPMDRVQIHFSDRTYDLALNIHSFSECTYAAIEWWLMQLAKMKVRHLMIVPNDPEQFQSLEIDHSRRDYLPLLQDIGYCMIAREAVFDDPAVQQLLGIRDNMFLFELKNDMHKT